MEFIGEVVALSIADAGMKADRWLELLEKVPGLPPEERRRVLDSLSGMTPEVLGDEGSAMLWNGIRALAYRHSEYADAAWSLPADDVQRLREIAETLAPTAVYKRVSWLFDEHLPNLGDISRRDGLHAFEEELLRQRTEAVRAVDREGGLEALAILTKETKLPLSVGISAADALGDKYLTELVGLAETDDPSIREMVFAFVGRRYTADGWGWMEMLFATHTKMSAKAKAHVLLATRDVPKAWEMADENGPEVANEYWALFAPYGLGDLEGTFIEYIARRMMAVDRFAASLDLLAMCTYRPDKLGALDKIASVIVDGLDGLLTTQDMDPELRQFAPYEFEALFGFLEKNKEAVGEDKLGALEWSYLPALGRDPSVPSLHAKMSRDYVFFVEMISTVYLPHNRDEGAKDSSPEKMRLAQNAYRLLTSWSVPPGLEPGGTVDGGTLESWVNGALVLLTEADRLEVGRQHIGQVFASSPPGLDGSWPPEAVRDLLEKLDSDDIDTGFRIHVYNGRGVTTRSLGEGGAQEFALAKEYRDRSKQFQAKWPRTAGIMRVIAESYEREGREQEEEAERFRQGLDL